MDSFKAHGGKIVNSETGLPPNTFIISSMDTTYNNEQFQELKQPILYPQALMALVYNPEFSGIHQLDVSKLSDYM